MTNIHQFILKLGKKLCAEFPESNSLGKTPDYIAHLSYFLFRRLEGFQ